jgi:DNA-binding GntR family transcriptional regulator
MSWKRHQPIVKSIQDGDGTAARVIIRAHMDEAAARVIRVVESRADTEAAALGS